MADLEVLALDEATPQIRAPGSGDGYLMPRPLTLTTGTITTDIKQVYGTVTWNDAAVTFTGWNLNVTDTGSAAASLLIDLKVGGVSKFQVRKLGTLGIAHEMYGGNTIGASTWALNGGGYVSASGRAVSWSSSGTFNYGVGTIDVYLYRDAAGNLAQRNGANAQTFCVYKTYTDASNYQRLTNTWSTSTAVIHNEGAGTGADGSVAFNDAALATDATKGFVMIPSCAGTPTGTPADIPTGQVPIVFDSTNNKLYVYDGGWLATAALT